MPNHEDTLLGRQVNYPQAYAPEVLQAIERSVSRQKIGLADTSSLPFKGLDIWNAYELSWLGSSGKPEVGRLILEIPATHACTVESKSLKLYLGAFNFVRFEGATQLLETLSQDLSAVIGGSVKATIKPVNWSRDMPQVEKFWHKAESLDELVVSCDLYHPKPELLSVNVGRQVDSKTWYTNLFRSLCPVTGQPDWARVSIHYSGEEISPEGLLQYLVSFRQHQGFHEACVEQLFVDIMARCSPDRLTVYAQFRPRGGIDINPFRSNYAVNPDSG